MGDFGALRPHATSIATSALKDSNSVSLQLPLPQEYDEWHVGQQVHALHNTGQGLGAGTGSDRTRAEYGFGEHLGARPKGVMGMHGTGLPN